jgi:hypothetical protein
MPGASLANQLPPPGPAQTIQAALPGGGNVGAPLIKAPYVRVVSVAAPGDSIMLPLTYGGDAILVFNDGASSLAVWGFGGATINGGTSAPQAAGVGALYFSSIEGTWHRFLQG